jgi:hypothetical protein
MAKIIIYLLFIRSLIVAVGHAVLQLVEALCYKPEGSGFNTQ